MTYTFRILRESSGEKWMRKSYFNFEVVDLTRASVKQKKLALPSRGVQTCICRIGNYSRGFYSSSSPPPAARLAARLRATRPGAPCP
jgi:hypothetical protein